MTRPARRIPGHDKESEMKQYLVAGKVFNDLQAACEYANFIAKVSRIIVAVEEVK